VLNPLIETSAEIHVEHLQHVRIENAQIALRQQGQCSVGGVLELLGA
jgi:hypothetical protein